MKTANDNNRICIVVAERGGDWAGWVERFQGESGGNVVLVVQQPNEDVNALAQRVRARIGDLDRSGGQLAQAVIVGGGRTDAPAMSARALAIKSLVAPMVRDGAGKLLLDGRGRDRFSMMALASTVASQVRGTGVRVTPATTSAPLAA